MYEIRFHGRGGQGGKMAAEAYALAAFLEGNYAVSFPFFGAERRGAPVKAFTRVDDKKIRIKTQVYEPDYVVVLDETLIETQDVLEGLKKDGTVIINTQRKPEEVRLSKPVKCATVDATG
ncbi:MAG: pyruvate ferredoxin oxidoreductase, partial [Thermoplasmata archaeon]